MAFDRFLIAPFNTGLQNDLKPWLIPDDAYTTLSNAYVFRGRVRKRFGGRLMSEGAPDAISQSLWSRFSFALTGGLGVGTVNAGAAVGNVPGNKFKIGQQFLIGTQVFTVTTAGLNPMLNSTGIGAATFNTATGAYTFAGLAAVNGTQIYWFPGEPVMALTNYESGFITNQPSYGFDTQFVYLFAAGRWVNSATTPTWHGTNIDFFWVTNWKGITNNITQLFATNFFINNPNGGGAATDDPIYTFDGNTWTGYSYIPTLALNPANVQPLTVTQAKTGTPNIITNYIQSARIILPFKNRLIMLNTIENGGQNATPLTPGGYLGSTNSAFTNRCRFSHNGSPFAKNAWLEPNQIYDPGTGNLFGDGGGFIDAPTDEQIISAEFIKDRLIVYFERSTWELAYTGNEVLPFVWQKINTELGSESTFSTVPFDKMVLTMGTTGVHACNGTNVERIDTKIPDQIFQIQNKNEGVERVVGIRDYFVEQVYWSFPSNSKSPLDAFPNQVLVYNYKNGSWALNDDCITSWGYFEQQSDVTWASTAPLTWAQYQSTWTSGVQQAQFRQIIAGNQEGFVFIADTTLPINAPVMSITDILNVGTTQLTIIDHNLAAGDFIKITSATGVTTFNDTIVQVQSVPTKDIVDLGFQPFVGVYSGGGFVARASRIDIQTKWLNPYIDKAKNVYIAKIDFGIAKTESGSITIDYYPSSTSLSMIQAGQATGSITGDNVLETSPYVLYPLEAQQDLLWHTIYLQTQGESIQLRIFLSDSQMLDATQNPVNSQFELQGMCLFTQPTGRLQ
jgi:hypothetical protein